VHAPLLLLGVLALGLLSFVGAASALLRARTALSGPRPGTVTAPSE
jgi:hypothetical protein